MNKGMLIAGVILISLFLITALIYTAENLKKTQLLNEKLILRNDSLHIEQLKVKKELADVRLLLDSLRKKNHFSTSP